MANVPSCIVAVPLLLSAAGLALSLLCLLPGKDRGVLEDFAIARVYAPHCLPLILSEFSNGCS